MQQRPPSMITDRRVQFVCGVVLLVFVVVAGIMILESVTHGGYDPKRYVGRVDPVRAGLVVLLGLACGLLTLFGAIAIVRWRRRPTGGSFADILMPLGLLVSTVAVLAWVIWTPSVPEPPAPSPLIMITLYAGVGLLLAGFAPVFAAGLAAAVRRRERGLLVVAVGLAIWILIGFLRRT